MATRCDVGGMCGLHREKIPCEVGRLSTELSIPEPERVEAQRICATVIERKLIKRKPLSVIAASSLYAACRESHTPVTLKELAIATTSDSIELGKCYRTIIGGMGITPPVLNGSRYIERVASRVHASEDSKDLAMKIAERAVDRGLGDRNPMTLAAAAVYTASLMIGENMTQSGAAEAAGVSEMSVRECAKAIRQWVAITAEEGRK